MDRDKPWVTTINRSTHFLGGMATFMFFEIKRSRASEGSDQATKDDFH